MKALTRRRADPTSGGDILTGPRVALEALRAGRRKIRRILLARTEGAGVAEAIRRLAVERGVVVEARTRADLDRLATGRTHQGVVVEAGPFPYVEMDEVISGAGRADAAFLIALDEIQDPQNLGAIIRTAEAAGAHGLILPQDRTAHVTSAVVRASAGAAEHVPVARAGNLAAFLEIAKGRGLWVVGADPSGSCLLHAVDLRVPLILVIGSEGSGLRPLVKRRCDFLVRIPLAGRVASLNASAAAAVCIFEVVRQRTP